VKSLRGWIPSIVSFAIGLGMLGAAFFGSYRPEVFAIVGGLLILQPATEWSIARRLSDFTLRATIQSDSFDSVWSRVNVQLREHEEKIEVLVDDVATLKREVVPLKAHVERVALRPALPKPAAGG
jgi:hypothetical protein